MLPDVNPERHHVARSPRPILSCRVTAVPFRLYRIAPRLEGNGPRMNLPSQSAVESLSHPARNLNAKCKMKFNATQSSLIGPTAARSARCCG